MQQSSPPFSSSMTLISARELTKRYPGVVALDSLTVDLEPGIIGFVGANGAGKSTFIRILLGLLPPTSGSVTVLGMDTVRQRMMVRRLVGYMPEHDCLPLDVSGTDLVTHLGQISGLPYAAARERAAEMLRHVGLYEERYRLIGAYSTGMKQRVKLAQALVHDPKLLLLDEPTNGLDPAGREEMLALVERTGREFGIAVLVTSHLLGEIERVCDYLIAIDAGRLHYAGPVTTFTEQTERLVLELDDDMPEFAARLRADGLDVEEDGHELRVGLRDEATYDIVRDAAADLEAPIARMEVKRHRLEELFRENSLMTSGHG
jgi:ABC-2 type transport system ATP-binding protein